MLEVISTLGAGFVKNLDDAFGVLPDCQPSRGFFNFNVRRYFAGSTSCSAEKKFKYIIYNIIKINMFNYVYFYKIYINKYI